MRKSIDLTPADIARATVARAALHSHLGETVTIDYVKRDGTPATMHGTVIGIDGTDDKECVRMGTDKGFRSANVWSIRFVTYDRDPITGDY